MFVCACVRVCVCVCMCACVGVLSVNIPVEWGPWAQMGTYLVLSFLLVAINSMASLN